MKAEQLALGAPEVEATLARVREALGTARLAGAAGGLELAGSEDEVGVARPFTLRFGPAGRFVRQSAGGLAEAAMFDGAAGWAVDWSGMPRRLELYDLEWTQLATWFWTGQWLLPGVPVE